MIDEEYRNDEDRIIENLLLDGQNKLYEDLDFLPTRQSLYLSEKQIPEYDDEVFQNIQWTRPHDIDPNASYFDSYNTYLGVRQGTLPDEAFLGALMGVCVYSKYDLIENIFASRPEDFAKYGVYTCRFYVDGEWVEVITDTNLPCLRNNRTGDLQPVYGRSNLHTELWIPLLEKAFAKAVGCYEAVTSMKIQKALLHLTGGSIQQSNLRDEVLRNDLVSDHHSWAMFKKRLQEDCLVMVMPEERKLHESTSAEDLEQQGNAEQKQEAEASKAPDMFFIPNRIYSVITYREMGGYELVLMHNPWFSSTYTWTGEWSDSANDWDLYPEMLVEIEKDPSIPWRRKQPNGYFWISFRHLVKYFNRMICCHLFPNDKFNFYCVRGECRGKRAGGLLQTIRDKDVVLKEASASRTNASLKSTAAVVVDGDSSWFNNPQFRINTNVPTTIYVSVIPLGNGEEGDVEHAQMSVSLLSSAKHSSSSLTVPVHLWDISQFETVGTDRVENGPIPIKGQETSLWGINIDPKHYYHIVPTSIRRGRDSDFVLRVFSTKPIEMEAVPQIPVISQTGEWRRVGDLDTTGGPPTLVQADGVTHKDNPKWCQNPQYHVQIANPYGKDEIFLKIVLRKVDHASRSGGKSSTSNQKASSNDDKKANATVGLVICKAEVLEDNASKTKKKAPRQNKLGEPILPKASSLKKHVHPEDVIDVNAAINAGPKTILRKLNLESSSYQLMTSYSSKTEACVFYPKLPRSWIPNGLLIVPCLSEKGVKGEFELEIYASETVNVNALPETYSRSIAGEWTESTAGGSHIFPATWKKNPKFTLRFHNPVTTDAPARFRITLARHGHSWKSGGKKDTVGNMIGFYIFLSHTGSSNEQTQIYESTFSPDEEVSTDINFALPQLQHGEVYTIMPCTFNDGKSGSFVLSILSEYEFHIKKES